MQDVSGFMVGAEAEHSGIIRAGARFVEAMATADVPKIVLTVNHASGAGYYAMAGQGFDPDFIFSWPTGRMGVMEGDSAVQAIFGTQLDKLKRDGAEPDEKLKAEMERVREDYEQQLDAKYAAARGLRGRRASRPRRRATRWSWRCASASTTRGRTSASSSCRRRSPDPGACAGAVHGLGKKSVQRGLRCAKLCATEQARKQTVSPSAAGRRSPRPDPRAESPARSYPLSPDARPRSVPARTSRQEENHP